MVMPKFDHVRPPPLSMEIATIFGKLIAKSIIDCVIKAAHIICMLIGNRHSCMLFEWHLPIAVVASLGIHHDGKGIHHAHRSKTTTKEIAKRHLYRWVFLIIPIQPQDKITKDKILMHGMDSDGEPEMSEHTRTIYVCQNRGLPLL